MSTQKPLKLKLEPEDLYPKHDTPLPDDFPFEVSSYAAGQRIVASKVPDSVADLLEDLRDAYSRSVITDTGATVPAGTVKYKTITTTDPGHADQFIKHAKNYSKNILANLGPDGQWSVRISRLSPNTVRIGVGPVRVRTLNVQELGFGDAVRVSAT